MIVANDVSQADAGFNVDTNRAVLLLRDGRRFDCPLMSKSDLAGMILDHIAAEPAKRKS
jgi:phosphopantothenoylcysteine decarboxylase/phosphopantothenate--cysteine ligase